MNRWLIGVLALLLGVGGGLMIARNAPGWLGSPAQPLVIADGALAAVRAQNRLVAFAARFTVAVTATQTRYGLTARKTMIVPGTVRYELDWDRLPAGSLLWNAAASTLNVTLPPLLISEPAVDLQRIREYDGGGLLLALTDAESALDAANRREVRAALLREARSPALVDMAKASTRAAVERTFLLPLRAAGIEDARVDVRFADDGKRAS